jgi:hypothetical protein
MSLPRRGSRIITVDGVRFRWVVTGQREPNCGIAVEDADAPSGLLLADADGRPDGTRMRPDRRSACRPRWAALRVRGEGVRADARWAGLGPS